LSSGATTIISAGTAIAVAQIFPTATQKFSPNQLNSGAHHHKSCSKPLAWFVLSKVKV
jgi:hypothetical protein